jgi:protein TonB
MQVAPRAPVGDQKKKNTRIDRPVIKPGDFSVKAPGAGAIGGFKMGPMQVAKPSASGSGQGAAAPNQQPAVQAPKPRPKPAVKKAQTPQHAAGKVQNIVPIRMDPPKYPREAAIGHKTGSVTVQFTVDTDGSTSDIRVLRSQPHKLFDKAAIRAVMHWRFRPYAIDGKPQARQVQQTIVFDLNKR